jgi:nucleoside 2-deoxyribosyltransferase
MRIYLAAPFSAFFGPSATAELVGVRRLADLIRALLAVLAEAGHTVANAHTRERFGERVLEPASCTPIDFLEILLCDAVVAFPDASLGAHVELGWASAWGKTILLIREEGMAATPLVSGLSTVCRCVTLGVPHGFGGELAIRALAARVVRELAALDPRPATDSFAVLASGPETGSLAARRITARMRDACLDCSDDAGAVLALLTSPPAQTAAAHGGLRSPWPRDRMHQGDEIPE